MDNEVNLSRVLGLKPLSPIPAGDQKQDHVSFVKTTAMPFSYKPHHDAKSYVENACDDSKRLLDFMNKKLGMNISRMLKNKAKGTSKVNLPIDIEDEGLNSTQNTSI